MKNLYPKGKGKKVYPSPAVSPLAVATLSIRPGEAPVAVLRLLPAAILALTAALGNEEKVVLAYLIRRSVIGLVAEDHQKCGRQKNQHHPPLFDCGCFDCYTNFWSRWNRSPNRELIHQAIEAFEEHLAFSEADERGKERRRERRVVSGDRPEKGKNKKRKDRKGANVTIQSAAEAPIQSAAEETEEEERINDDTADIDIDIDHSAEAGGDRRRAWADVTAFFNSRVWNIWSPGD